MSAVSAQNGFPQLFSEMTWFWHILTAKDKPMPYQSVSSKKILPFWQTCLQVKFTISSYFYSMKKPLVLCMGKLFFKDCSDKACRVVHKSEQKILHRFSYFSCLSHVPAVDGDDVIMPLIIIIVSPWATCIYNYYMIIVHKYGNKNHTFWKNSSHNSIAKQLSIVMHDGLLMLSSLVSSPFPALVFDCLQYAIVCYCVLLCAYHKQSNTAGVWS